VVCGPLPFDQVTSVEGGVNRFGADGALLTPEAAPAITTAQPPRTGTSVNAA
jgi:hypothetical protein